MPPPKLYRDRALFTDLDENLLGDTAALDELVQLIRSQRKCAIFGIATGRSLESALKLMRRHHIPMPDVLICSQGTEIHFAPDYMPDKTWLYHIDHLWTPNRVRTLLDELPGLSRQPREAQSRYKLSYFIDPKTAPALTEIQSLLHQNDQTVNVTLSFGQFLDVLPIRASKGFAVRWFADQWDVPLERILVVGGAGADADMMRGNTLAVVVSTCYSDELYELTDAERIYFAHYANARGILEGIEHYDFFGQCHIPHREIQ
jgi:sucrose-phosphate synthase